MLELVSVIIPTRNSAKFLQRCLESIKKQSYQPLELIVVDNNSSDNTKEIASRYTKNIYNYGPERSAQINFGVSQATGKYVYKVDSDFVLDKNVVSQCVEKINAGFDAVIVHNTPDTSISWIAKVRKFETDMYKYDLDHSSARFLSKDVYCQIGGFNERFSAGEDYDFQNRLTRKGFKTGFIEAEAVHLGESLTLRQELNKYYRYGRDFYKYRKSNPVEYKIQLSFVRRVYLKHWKNFFINYPIALLFIFYHVLKFLAGTSGYLSVLVGYRTKRV